MFFIAVVVMAKYGRALYKMCSNLDVVVRDLELANSTLVNGFLVALTTKKVSFFQLFSGHFFLKTIDILLMHNDICLIFWNVKNILIRFSNM